MEGLRGSLFIGYPEILPVRRPEEGAVTRRHGEKFTPAGNARGWSGAPLSGSRISRTVDLLPGRSNMHTCRARPLSAGRGTAAAKPRP